MQLELYAKSAPEWTLLSTHLKQVSMAATTFAKYLGMDKSIALNGAILHDIGKAHPFFQERLKGTANKRDIFRHEIVSLFFLSVFPKEQWDAIIEMVVGHHKSVMNDRNEMGLLDLEEAYEYQEFHLGKWEEWSAHAFKIINELGISCQKISKEEALNNLQYCIDYCDTESKRKGYSNWRGLLMGADHFASSLINETEHQLNRIFKKPNLNFYNRQHPLYPLSYKNAHSNKKHTIVIACTGAGKTDYLFRRCRGRVFYTLPFQASINAMYKRVGRDLEEENPNIDIRVLHSTSIIVKRKEEEEEVALQSLIGSAIKILTPHQLATIALGMKGYEAMILDLKGCDIILDEIHTYSGVSQALVLKLIEVLKAINCHIHIGTATMPTILYNKVKELLGEDVLEVKLENEELDKFNRHIVHKLESFEIAKNIISEGVNNAQKILVVMNTIKDSQEVFKYINDNYPHIPSMLLHSKFKRGDRNIKERQLLGLDDNGAPINEFNTSKEACIVVSTQIVEVSLDISFDIMITATAPLDAMIQRFGRVNRKRNIETIGKLKNVYVIAPSETSKEAKPYDLTILQKSFDVLDDGKVLEERKLQPKIDQVFTEINFLQIEEHSVFKSNGNFMINKLTHRSKAILFELLDIDSVSCIIESDVELYENENFEVRLNLEIPVAYWSVANMNQSKKGNKPFIIPDVAYDFDLGLNISKIKQENFNVLNQFL
ncbi:CRISPR-associated helicase Cas3' [Sphingobacterium sp. SRCM116780]|uniref:CRISPR-associated helicase Cas3' n=1 Tax=Sphingobacterium sp. SRCM116780 TaxID=2907623 RepID=UPI001F357851|nr:CRISPR-associated helicase Cas3' [Sphingobacterium sp. SRCM116780]UIR57328.1 CRISPR-associated helicase Cas3' [Sphingobacterium sp. SRCM116780]